MRNFLSKYLSRKLIISTGHTEKILYKVNILKISSSSQDADIFIESNEKLSAAMIIFCNTIVLFRRSGLIYSTGFKVSSLFHVGYMEMEITLAGAVINFRLCGKPKGEKESYAPSMLTMIFPLLLLMASLMIPFPFENKQLAIFPESYRLENQMPARVPNIKIPFQNLQQFLINPDHSNFDKLSEYETALSLSKKIRETVGNEYFLEKSASSLSSIKLLKKRHCR